jgi:radical SAM protein with 4Fe4S-binding SPASM domain
MTVDQQLTELKSQFNVIDIIDCNDYNDSLVDLYNRIQKLYQPSFNESDKIIFLITKDFYKKDSACGIILQSLQSILNDIDISNFFVSVVTTNTKIEEEYQWALNNISIDKVPVHIHKCAGEYNRLTTTNQLGYIKYQKIENINNIESLTEKHKQLLFDSDSFCMLPWTSMMIDPSSKVKPCCVSTESIGDCSKQSLKQIWNSDSIKQIRKNMLADKKIESCNDCYVKESLGIDTLRKAMNRRFINRVNKVDLTNEDGYLSEYSLNYLDARFNNLCNLSCRSCLPNNSSSWYQPALAIGKIDKSVKALRIAGKTDSSVYEQILEHLGHLERIYFAGGEPLMIDQFYTLVEELDAKGRHDVELIYNINMTKSSLSGKSIFDVWKNFKKISIGASLDGEHERGEYLRSGQCWNDVLNFRKEMLEKRPDIDFYISATVSIINALHLPDFHKSWVEQGLIKPEDFNIGLLLDPNYLRVDCAPEYLKDRIRKKYHAHLEWLRPKDPIGRATYGFESVINYLDNDKEFDPKDFWANITPLDQYYGLNLLEVFPELSTLSKD